MGTIESPKNPLSLRLALYNSGKIGDIMLIVLLILLVLHSVLLERVFLRLGSAETDEQLQASVCKFLPPVLLKLSSAQEGVRKKVMELLIHINKRIKSRPQVQLPVEALLLQYQDPAASSFVIVRCLHGYYNLQIREGHIL